MAAALTRLHITPFTQDLLPFILGSAIIRVASNISYHSLDNFPEKSYGYVDLPHMEAEKIKKKLNGAILKGKKVKVEEARPRKRKHIDDAANDPDQEEKSTERTTEREKGSRSTANVIQGHELSPERKVKRGWTEPALEKSRKKKDKSKPSTRSQAASKYTDKEELLFRAKVPKNKISRLEKDEKRRKKDKGNPNIVHEFENSTKMPSFLRNEASVNKTAVAYEDGKGWVDGEGNTVEQEDVRASNRRKAAKRGIEDEVVQAQSTKRVLRKGVATALDEDVSLESSNQDTLDLQEGNAENSIADTDATSSSGSSTSASESTNSSDLDDSADDSTHSANVETTPTKPLVHPLEALFKKPSKPASSQGAINSQDVIKPSLEIQTSFSFFNTNDDDLPTIPMTPFSSQDVRHRELRSAAPTPDTAHPSRMSSIFNGEESDGELSEMDDSLDRDAVGPSSQQNTSSSQSLQVPQTDFEKQFWEKRGENNRAWKARRKAVLKEKRQRENRARRPRNW